MGFGGGRNSVRIARLLGLGVVSLTLANCTTDNVAERADRRHTVSSRALVTGELTTKRERTPRQHTVLRHQTAPHISEEPAKQRVAYSAVGVASWYGEDFHGRPTANGETFNMNSFTAAHPSLPLPSNVRITNLDNHRSIIVRVNDRGPYVSGRVIDVSAKTAKELGFYDDGLGKVKVEYVGRAQ
jgi:rare lipoprotein A